MGLLLAKSTEMIGVKLTHRVSHTDGRKVRIMILEK